MGDVDQFEDTRTAWQKTKAKIKDWWNPKWTWIKDHKEIAIPVATAIISGAVELTKAGMKYHDKAEERQLEEEKLASVYDRSAGMYLSTTRPLDNDDWRRVQELKRKGKTTGEALDQLGLLR